MKAVGKEFDERYREAERIVLQVRPDYGHGDLADCEPGATLGELVIHLLDVNGHMKADLATRALRSFADRVEQLGEMDTPDSEFFPDWNSILFRLAQHMRIVSELHVRMRAAENGGPTP